MANLGGFASDNDDAEGVVLEVAPAPVKLIPPKMLDDPDPDDDVSEVEAPVGLFDLNIRRLERTSAEARVKPSSK